MKKILIILCITMTSCIIHIPGYDIRACEAYCTSHGGIQEYVAVWKGGTCTCADGTEEKVGSLKKK